MAEQSPSRIFCRRRARGASFPDAIGRAKTILDTHFVDYEFESDEVVFYYWVCRAFQERLSCGLPYRMLLPQTVRNVWIACRAAGMAGDTAYGLRMQRDMQRLGEAAGAAAALAVRSGADSRGIDLGLLQRQLEQSGALQHEEPRAEPELASDWEKLLSGKPGIHLWRIAHHPEASRERLREAMASQPGPVSFYAACILAFHGDPISEKRLLQALEEREEGVGPTSNGAWGQEVDIPFWLLAVVLIRRCGTEASLPALEKLAQNRPMPFNLRTILGLTVERLASHGQIPGGRRVEAILDALTEDLEDPILLPASRSLWRTLRGEPPLKLGNSVRPPEVWQDYAWQLRQIVGRTRVQLSQNRQAGGASEPRRQGADHPHSKPAPHQSPSA